MMTEPSNFWTWFDRVTGEANASPVGRIMTANGFRVEHTGGGCMAWQREIDTRHFAWITDGDHGLGDDPAAVWTCGIYRTVDGECVDFAEIIGADTAVAWCNMRLAAALRPTGGSTT